MPHSESNDTLNQQDEISLAELWRMIVVNRSMVYASLAIFIAAGVLLALLRPTTYTVTSVIEVGYLVQEGKREPLESPDSVKAKIETALAPSMSGESGQSPKLDKLSVDIPNRSNLLTITSNARADEVDHTKTLQKNLIGRLVEDHDRLLNLHRTAITSKIAVANEELQRIQDERLQQPEKRKLEAQLQGANAALKLISDPLLVAKKEGDLKLALDGAKQELEALKEMETLYAQNSRTLSQEKKLLGQHVIELQQILAKAEASKPDSGARSAESNAMMLLVLNNDLQNSRIRLNNLEFQLYIKLEERRATLEQQASQNRRSQRHQTEVIAQREREIEKFKIENMLAQQKQQAEIAKIEASLKELEALQEQRVAMKKLEINELAEQIDNLSGTQAITRPMRSQLPVGSPKSVILFLAGLLGLIIGILGVFAKLMLQKGLLQTVPAGSN
jgi:hypothetical protein